MSSSSSKPATGSTPRRCFRISKRAACAPASRGHEERRIRGTSWPLEGGTGLFGGMRKALAQLLPDERRQSDHGKAQLAAELAGREALLTSLLESSPAGLVVSTRDGQVRFASAKWLSTFGYTLEELSGTLTRELYADPDEGEPAVGALERAGNLRDYECRFRRKDGSVFWGMMNSSFVDIGGERLAATWIEDLTEQRAAKLALEVANQERNAMFEATTAGIALVRNRIFVYCNRRLEEVFGYGPGEMVDRSTRILYPSDEEATKGGGDVYVRIWRGETDRREQQMVRKDGTLFWCRLRGRAVDRNDQSKGTVWLLEDVTEERSASEALTRALTDVQAIHDTLPHGMITAQNRCFVRTNATFDRMLGYMPGEVLGKSARIMFESDEAYEDAGERLYAAMRAGTLSVGEFRLVRKDGSRFLARMRGAAINRSDPPQSALSLYEDVTEARASSEALERALADLKAIYDTSPHGMATSDNRCFLQTNAAFDQMLGYLPGELIGKSSRVLYESDEFYKESGDRLYAALQVGKTLADEFRLVRKDGSRLWARITVAAMNRSDPRKGTLGIYEDVTEERKAAEALRQALDRQQKIFEASPHGIATFARRHFVLTSPAADRMFGYGPGELHGRSIRTVLMDDETYDRIGREVYDTLRGGAPVHVQETLFKRKDGSTFWGRATAAALDRDDPLKGVVAVYEDITERKTAEQALRAAHEQQQAILRSASSGIALIKDNVLVDCNRRFEEIFGRERSDFLRTPTGVFGPQEGKRMWARISQGKTYRGEHSLSRIDGTQFWCRVSGRAIDPSDLKRGTVWMLDDVTEERAAAEALREAKQVAEEATQAKSMFLANMSHEIRA